MISTTLAEVSIYLASKKNKKYKILENPNDIPNTQNTHTSLVPCSILSSLKGKDIKTNKPSKPVKLTVTIQYIELSSGISEIEK